MIIAARQQQQQQQQQPPTAIPRLRPQELCFAYFLHQCFCQASLVPAAASALADAAAFEFLSTAMSLNISWQAVLDPTTG
jgi:hypothetical protein